MDERQVGRRAEGRRVNLMSAEDKKRWVGGVVPYMTDRRPRNEPGDRH